MNLFHKAEFAANLPKVTMYDYGVTIIRPLIYTSEKEIKEFAKLYGFNRITCQCPVGQNSLRKQTDSLKQASTMLLTKLLEKNSLKNPIQKILIS